MTVVRLDHVNIVTPRLRETIAFYEVLGLRCGPLPVVPPDPEAEPLGAWLYDSRELPILHLIASREALAPVSSPIDHFALNCQDYDAYAGRLTAQGVEFAAADYPSVGVRQLVVHDPNGLKVELNFEMRS